MSKWGGKREGAGSGGKREGAGRPRANKWNAGANGTVWFVEFAMPNGLPSAPHKWRLLGIEENNTLVFQNVDTEEIITIIHPDKYL